MSTATGEHRGSKEYFLVYAELITAARHRGTVTYQELADLIGLPVTGTHMGNELGKYLGAISENEVHHGRPMLSAIAVTTEGKPGGGFFSLAMELNKLSDKGDQHKFWEVERNAVYKTWQKTF